jgi:hypothetical protein
MRPFVPFFDYMYSAKARWVAVKRQWGVSIEHTFFRNGKLARLKDLEKFTPGNGIHSKFAGYWFAWGLGTRSILHADPSKTGSSSENA